ncbi:hypothetical protein [Rufibacter hautae]|uniref:Uncharacterized protein n=1 Tax=Rufibacter hautae TaxID=2595005 RepID=A0A5B6TSY6_9BACT|nr:hypothetical protein [Rufibacter hautae]KAA3439608.1 hypothetical protein FOA19_02700 [Rufibacter hautae]
MIEVAVLFIYGIIGATIGLLGAFFIRKIIISFLGKSMVSVGIGYCLVLIGVILFMNMGHPKVENLISLLKTQQKATVQAKV